MPHYHVTHLLARYCHGQLRPAQHARVANHIRQCPECRAALAREERFVADLKRELPTFGQARPAQLANVWAGVLDELSVGVRRKPPVRSWPWLPGLSMALAVMLLVVVALPILAAGDAQAEAAPQQPRPISTASPTPGVTDTLTARQPAAPGGLSDPQATVALARTDEVATLPAVSRAGATPAPVPGIIVSPVGTRH